MLLIEHTPLVLFVYSIALRVILSNVLNKLLAVYPRDADLLISSAIGHDQFIADKDAGRCE